MCLINKFFSWCVLASFIFSVDLVVEPYLQNATPTSMTILWETDSDSNSIVEWGLQQFLTNVPRRKLH